MLSPKFCFQKNKHGFDYSTRITTSPLSESLLINGVVHGYGEVAYFPPYIKKTSKVLCVYLDGDVYLPINDYLIFYQALKNDFDRFSKHIIQLHYRYFPCFLKEVKNTFRKNQLASKSNVKLSRLLNNYFLAFNKCASIVSIPFAADYALRRLLQEELAKQHINEFRADEIIFALSKPKTLSFTVREKHELEKLAQRIADQKEIKKAVQNNDLEYLSKKQASVFKALRGHAKKYAWLGFLWFSGKPLQLEYFLRRIQNILEEKTLQPRAKIKPINFQLTLKIKKLSAVLKEISYLRTWRLELSNQAASIIYPLFEETAKRLNLNTVEELSNLNPEEIGAALRGELTNYRDIIKERQKGFGIVFDSRLKVVAITGHTLSKFQKYFSKMVIGDYKEAASFSGVPVYKGVVTGRVAVITHPSQFHEFKKGDILVSAMTTPDFMPILEQSSAIVTDIGGVTSHAAVIARELHIPCVVGTKIATRTLKNGDVVKVDSERGVITKITHNQILNRKKISYGHHIPKRHLEAIKIDKMRRFGVQKNRRCTGRVH